MTFTLLDPLGASCSLLATYYFTQAKSRAFPLSLLAILINAILYYQRGIYAHVALEGAYLVSSLYGWYYWSTPKATQPAAPIAHMPRFYLIMALGCTLLMIPMLAHSLLQWTQSTIPYWDATTTLLALLAQWMLCKKWIECWAAWFVVDALVMIVHLMKGIPFHSALHGFYLVMAVMGYLKWRNILLQRPSPVY